jgi:hypothetical protein
MTSGARWEDVLWTDLKEMNIDEQFIVSGEWTTYITRGLLPDLARYRRFVLLDALSEEGVDSGVLADRLGGRRATIDRLASEARALRRDEAA